MVVYEAEDRPGRHTSSRNSEVIHSGIYYPKASLKARFCVRGKNMLYRYCEEFEVRYKKKGKLIIAVDESEIEKLQELKTKAENNGVDDLEWLTTGEIRKLEPEINAVCGLLSPSTGIIDSDGLMMRMEAKAEQNGATMQMNSKVINGEAVQDGVILQIERDNKREVILYKNVINSAGLWAQSVAKSIAGIKEGSVPDAYYAKGHYFFLSGESPFNHLIYPVPVAGGLGVHVTLDLENSARFGPDVSWVNFVDYGFDEGRSKDFYEAIRRYYPNLMDGKLNPGYTGIRPKLAPSGSPDQDFVIQTKDDHGVPGLINLFGIESPGLTASLAIAEHVGEIIN